MDSVLHRVSFDFTPDDLADVSIRYVTGTAGGRAARRRAIVATGIAGAGGCLLVFVLLSGLRDATSVSILAAIAALVGLLTAYHQAVTYESAARRRVLRALTAELGRESMRCDVELRDDGAWARQHNVQVLHAWKDVTSVEDVVDGVEMRFRGGYLLVRSSAFANPADRAVFLETARRLAGPTASH